MTREQYIEVRVYDEHLSIEIEDATKEMLSDTYSLHCVGGPFKYLPAGDVLFEHLLPIAGELTPDKQGGAMLLGLDGICFISHGSSNATAIMNALRVASEMDKAGVVEKLRLTIRPDQG